jgi:two-component system, response regulator RegA
MNTKPCKTNRLLLVEDDQSQCDVYKAALESEHLTVVVARSSNDACALLENGNFHLTLLDWGLSECRKSTNEDPTGATVLKRCREIDPHLPVIVMSGLISVDVRSDSLLNQADSYLQKPFSMGLLWHHVSRWLERVNADKDQFRLRDETDILPLQELERRYVTRVLEILGGNISDTGRRLDLHRQTVTAFLQRRPLHPRRQS